MIVSYISVYTFWSKFETHKQAKHAEIDEIAIQLS